MSKIGIFMADGCEEIEGLTVVDLLRRAKIEIEMIGVMGNPKAAGAHGISFDVDVTLAGADYDSYDGIVLPGGMPGTNYLRENAKVNEVIKKFAAEGKLVAAICAAPSVLGLAGILDGKHATSYPGFEPKLLGAICETSEVVRDGNVITSRGMGTAIPFALEIISYFQGAEAKEAMGKSIMYRV